MVHYVSKTIQAVVRLGLVQTGRRSWQEARRSTVRQKTSLGLEWELTVLQMPRQSEAKGDGKTEPNP